MKRYSGKINLDSLEWDLSDMILDDLNEFCLILYVIIDLYFCILVVIDVLLLSFYKMWFWKII